MQLTRFSKNPIIAPSENWWEMYATFNPSATTLDGKIVLLYRAIGGDSFSRFGLAVSDDGYNFQRFSEPVFEADIDNHYERLGVEDPRITRIDETYYICYTAPSVYPATTYKSGQFAPSLSHPAPWRVRPSLLTTTDFKTFSRHGFLLDVDSKDATLFPEKIAGRYCLLHRPYPNLNIAFSDDLKNWTDQKIFIQPRRGFWDSERIGVGAAPIKTEKGWLLFYHGTNEKQEYMLGILLLDLVDPRTVIYRSPEPILKPEEAYEKTGLTPNVVFTCGAIERDGKYFIYYGAADKVIGLATIDKNEILSLS